MTQPSTKDHSSNSEGKYSYSASAIIMLSAYITALVVAYLSYPYVKAQTSEELIQKLILDIIVTAVVFLFSFAIKNSCVYDPYWSVCPTVTTLFWISKAKNPAAPKNILILVAAALFAAKHLYLYFRLWSGFNHEDFRFLNVKKDFAKFPNLYWLVAFLGFHLFPALMVWGGLVPVYFAIRATEITSPVIFYGGVLFTIGAVILEHFADEQLFPWRIKKSDKFIDVGLWRYSRHPNYLGEIMFWVGLAIIVQGTNGAQQWTWVGALVIYLLFDRVTIPLMEKHLLENRPAYAVQMKRVSKLFLWFRNEKAAQEYEAKMGKAK